jgi:hypothetical protein
MGKRVVERDLAFFMLLTAIGVAGRWWQPIWNFTPVAAVGMLAAWHFRAWWQAALVPVAVMGISNLVLPAYSHPGVMAAVYVAFLLPTVSGRLLRGRRSALALGASCFASAVVFFALSNLAHWWFLNQYAHTFAGLVECYVAALPFFKWTLYGDLTYGFGLFGAYLAWSAIQQKETAAVCGSLGSLT